LEELFGYRFFEYRNYKRKKLNSFKSK
jgi:hypothetical protein